VTSPAAQIRGCAVRRCSSTSILPARADGNPDRVQVQPGGGGPTAGGDQQLFGVQLDRLPVPAAGHGDTRVVPPNGGHRGSRRGEDALLAQHPFDDGRDLGFLDWGEPGQRFDDAHLDPEPREQLTSSKPIAAPPSTISDAGSSSSSNAVVEVR
jgi:hypothetical protein